VEDAVAEVESEFRFKRDNSRSVCTSVLMQQRIWYREMIPNWDYSDYKDRQYSIQIPYNGIAEAWSSRKPGGKEKIGTAK
jgi:hypothetical protein